MIWYPHEYNSFVFVTRVPQLIQDVGKYLLISIYPPYKFTYKNGGNLNTLPDWPLLTQGTLVPYNEMKNICLYRRNICTESVMHDCQQPQLMYKIYQVQNDNDYT